MFAHLAILMLYKDIKFSEKIKSGDRGKALIIHKCCIVIQLYISLHHERK